MLVRILPALLLILCSTVVAQDKAKDWPSFRNSARDNKSLDTGLVDNWPAGGPELLFTATGLGEGYSSVSIVGDLIYTMGNVDGAEHVIALNRNDGSIAWKKRNGREYEDGTGNGPRGTPTYADGNLYSLGGNGDLSCLDAKTGDEQWRVNILKRYGGKNIVWGISESVLVDDGKVICTPGGTRASVVALDAGTGKVRWTCKIPGDPQAGYASPRVAEVGGVKQYVIFESQGMVGIRAKDGFGMWGRKKASNSTANCATPLVVDDYVFCSSDYGTGAELVRLKSRSGKTTSDSVYFTRDMKNHHGGMVHVNGHIYGSDSSKLVCVNMKSGKPTWQQRGKGSVVFADGKILFRNENGELVWFKANPQRYEELGRFKQPDRSGRPAWSHPVIVDGRLYLRDMDKLLVYNMR